MNPRWWTMVLVGILTLVAVTPGCREKSRYLPSIDNGDGSYSFSEEQLKEMARTPLDRCLFLRYVEAKWPLDKVEAFCIPKNRWPGVQNLVPEKLCFNEWEIPVHKGKQHSFDKICVYVGEDEGKSKYFGSVAQDWRRWTYSLNISRGKDNWVIIESLPNDFMDNPSKYLPQQVVEAK